MIERHPNLVKGHKFNSCYDKSDFSRVSSLLKKKKQMCTLHFHFQVDTAATPYPKFSLKEHFKMSGNYNFTTALTLHPISVIKEKLRDGTGI